MFTAGARRLASCKYAKPSPGRVVNHALAVTRILASGDSGSDGSSSSARRSDCTAVKVAALETEETEQRGLAADARAHDRTERPQGRSGNDRCATPLAEDTKIAQQPPQQYEYQNRSEAAAAQLLGSPPRSNSTQEFAHRRYSTISVPATMASTFTESASSVSSRSVACSSSSVCCSNSDCFGNPSSCA